MEKMTMVRENNIVLTKNSWITWDWELRYEGAYFTGFSLTRRGGEAAARRCLAKIFKKPKTHVIKL